MLTINGLPAALVTDNTALLYDQAARSVILQRVCKRDDGTYAGIISLRSFSSESELTTLERFIA